MGKYKLGQRVRIVHANNIHSRFGIVHEQWDDLPCYFIKVGCKEDYGRNLLKIYGNDVEHCILLGEASLEPFEKEA